MQSDDWDRRYGGEELVWSIEPNRFVAAETAALSPGRALDVACGEGRNAIWLAQQGWEVVAADFSAVALDKGRRLSERAEVTVEWVEADITAWDPPGPFDLIVVSYLQLPAGPLTMAFGRLVPALGPGGTLVVVGHDRRNLAEGVGGPQSLDVLLDAEEVLALLPGLEVERAGVVERPVEGADRPALDTLVRAHRPAGGRP
jgi:SAM-dependent methyltransferase